MRKAIAITGKIGSGKTSVLIYLKQKGHKVLSADLIYKNLLETNEEFVQEICSALGVKPLVYEGKKMLDRIAVKQLVFSDKEKLALLNSVTHPKIMQQMILEANESEGVVFCEVPLLAESGCDKYFNAVWEVVRENNARLYSVTDRDDISFDMAEKITQNQKTYEIKEGIEHTFIYNNSSLEDLYKKVDALEKNL